MILKDLGRDNYGRMAFFAAFNEYLIWILQDMQNQRYIWLNHTTTEPRDVIMDCGIGFGELSEIRRVNF